MAGGKHILGKPKSHRIFGTARVGERGQIVIPKEARQFYGIRPGDTVLVLGSGESGLVLSKPEVLDRVAQQILEDMGRNEAVSYTHLDVYKRQVYGYVYGF